MKYTVKEIQEFIEEHDVKFIRLAFCDIFGNLKNIAVQAGELARIMKYGVSFDASAFRGFMNVEESDLFLFPDLSTLAYLPWRPQQDGVIRLYCDICYPDGRPFPGDARFLLKTVAKRAREMGYTCRFGAECEFYLFEQDENGNPTQIPQDEAGYCDVAPLDKGENIRREICLNLEGMGVKPECSHHEHGPGQNEVDFKYADPLTAADDMVTFRSVVKTVASLNGLHASFMPKPMKDQSGNGLHINISLQQDGENIFKLEQGVHSAKGESFIAGILAHMREMTIFLNPLTNSYRRLGAFEAPSHITWSHQNRSQLIRIPAATNEAVRMELRSPDSSCNPYLVYSLLISAGLMGIERNLKLEPANNLNFFHATEEEKSGIASLPGSLIESIDAARNSQFINNTLPEKIRDAFLMKKEEEWEHYCQALNREEYEMKQYFKRI